MTERKSGRNPLAVILAALLVLHVLSYIGIRFASGRFPPTGPDAGMIFFGLSQSEFKACCSTGAATNPASVRIAGLLQTLYLPLRKADRWITHTAI